MADAAAMRYCMYMLLKVVLDVMSLLVSAWMKVRYSDQKLANQFIINIHHDVQKPLH